MNGFVYDVKNVRTIRELIEGSAAEFGDRTAFLWRGEYGDIKEITYTEAYSDVAALAAYLNGLGLEGSKIAVYGRNCYEWAITYLAVCCGVGIIVPIDKELKSGDVNNILNVSEASAIIYTPDRADTVAGCGRTLLRLCTSDFAVFLAEGRKAIAAAAGSAGSNDGAAAGSNTDVNDYGAGKFLRRHAVDPDAPGILLFTSGTTGVMKGVLLSQNNICSNITAVRKRVWVSPDDRVLSVLPLHHTYECMAGFLAILYSGASIAYAESLRRLSADMVLFRPTIIIAVPLLLENLRANIMKKILAQPGGALKLALGRGAARLNKAAGKKAFAAVHEAFGGKLRIFICGAAALTPDVYRDFNYFGFDVYAGYGLTETSPVCIMHDDFVHSPGDIGRPVSGTSVKLDSSDDEYADGVGEILVKGPNVMLGYYNNPEETERVIEDGWFHTGDLGQVDKNGCYRIVGRIKNMIVTKNGKKIFPEEMEYLLEKSEYVKESVVYGAEGDDGDTVVAAKIFPNFELVNAKLAEKGISEGGEGYIDALRELFRGVVKEVNRGVPAYKMIHRFRIRSTEFAKTTTRKIKRSAQDIDSDYLA